jgi:hypothetical protein
LLKKVGEDVDTEENAILRDFYLESLLQHLYTLKSQDKELSLRKFNTETQIFIPEILGDIGEASALDFVTHATAGKDLEIFCIISKWGRLTNVIKSSVNRKLTIHRLASIKDHDSEGPEMETRLKLISDSLKSTSQGQFIKVYDKNK